MASSKIFAAHCACPISLAVEDWDNVSNRKSISGAESATPFITQATWRSGLLIVFCTSLSAVLSSLSKAHEVEYCLMNIHSRTFLITTVSLSSEPESGMWILNSAENSLKPSTSFFLCFAQAVYHASLMSLSLSWLQE